MATYPTSRLLADLRQGFQAIAARVETFRTLPPEQLVQAPAPGSWSVVQVLEHLNFYSREYDRRLGQAIRNAGRQGGTSRETYRSGWLGDYFVALMAPKPDGTVRSKMKAPAASAPSSALRPDAVLDAFRDLQRQLLQHVENAGTIRADRVRVATMLPLVSLRVGDSLRFLLAHQERHLAQAARAAAVRR